MIFPAFITAQALRLTCASLVLVLLGGCAAPPPAPQAAPFPSGAGVPLAPPPPPAAAAVPIPGEKRTDSIDAPVTVTRVHRLSRDGLKLTVLTFDQRRCRLSVLDNQSGPGTGATSAALAASSAGALAAINGGFFTPEGQPLGLVIEDGARFGALNSSSLGSGIYYHDRNQASGLVRRETWKRGRPARSPDSLLQAGPFLVEGAKAVAGLSTSRSRPRSFLAWDGRSGWALGYVNSASLARLGAVLAGQPVPGFTIDKALNLDGGSSSDLWISGAVKGGPASARPFWSKPARNYLVLKPAP